MSTEETLNIEKNLGKLQKRMEEEKRDNNFQARVMEMARKVQNGKRFATLIKNLANPKLDFWNFLNELWIGYILIDYNPEYESKYINTNPDFKVVMNNQTVWIEVKDKEETTLEKDIRKKFDEIKPSCIEILAKKVQEKYSCVLSLDFLLIPPKEFNLVKRLEELPQKIEKISPEKIYEGSEVTLDNGTFFTTRRDPKFGKEYKMDYKYEIVLHFLTRDKEEWDIVPQRGGIGIGATFGLLKDIIAGNIDDNGIIIREDEDFRNGLLYKFDNRNNNDITIGIIDPTSRRYGIGDAKMSFNFRVAKATLKNIMFGNDPNRTTFPWHDEVKKKIDVIFLVCANPIKYSENTKIEPFISSLSNENKIPVIEKIFHKICATKLPS